jgi:IMP dehydrogenase/GMP reductase
MFVEKLLNTANAFSVDNVYLVPGLVEVDLQKIDLRTRFGRNRLRILMSFRGKTSFVRY